MAVGYFIDKATLPQAVIGQYKVDGSCVAIGPNHFITAQHVDHSNAGLNIVDGVHTYTVVDHYSAPDMFPSNGVIPDLLILRIAETLPSWHPIANPWDLGLTGDRTQSGVPIGAFIFGGFGDTNTQGNWAPVLDNHAERWGYLDWDATYTFESGYKGDFNTSARIQGTLYNKANNNRVCPCLHDSGGGFFMLSGGNLYLVGILNLLSGVGQDGGGNFLNGASAYGEAFSNPVLSWINTILGKYPRWTPKTYSFSPRTITQGGTGASFDNPANAVQATATVPTLPTATFALATIADDNGTKQLTLSNFKDDANHAPAIGSGEECVGVELVTYMSTDATGTNGFSTHLIQRADPQVFSASSGSHTLTTEADTLNAVPHAILGGTCNNASEAVSSSNTYTLSLTRTTPGGLTDLSLNSGSDEAAAFAYVEDWCTPARVNDSTFSIKLDSWRRKSTSTDTPKIRVAFLRLNVYTYQKVLTGPVASASETRGRTARGGATPTTQKRRGR